VFNRDIVDYNFDRPTSYKKPKALELRLNRARKLKRQLGLVEFIAETNNRSSLLSISSLDNDIIYASFTSILRLKIGGAA